MAKGAHKKGKFQKREPKEFAEEVIQIDRVTRVVKGGRKLRFRATIAIGNKKGKIGVGVGKSHEVTGAIKKAINEAKKNLVVVPIDGSTIPHDIKIKYKASKILLMPAGPGTGIIAGGAIRKVLELAGYNDILSKSLGTTNKLNNTKATVEALKQLRETPLMLKKIRDKKEKAEANKAKAPVKTHAKTHAKPQTKTAAKVEPKTEKKTEDKKVAEKPKTEIKTKKDT